MQRPPPRTETPSWVTGAAGEAACEPRSADGGYDLVIFDLDGTLVDSFAFFVASHNRLAAAYGFRAIDPGEVEALRGRSPTELMRRTGLPMWKLPFVARGFRRLMHHEGDGIECFAQVDAALAALHASGTRLALVSSNSMSNCRRLLGARNWARFAHAECGAGLFGKARRLRRVLRTMRVPAARAIYVGDQTTDAQAARAAGLAFGAVAWGYATIESLQVLAPERVLGNVMDLASLHSGHRIAELVERPA